MIVYDLNVYGVGRYPTEADLPLVIDPDAVLSQPVAGQSFKNGLNLVQRSGRSR